MSVWICGSCRTRYSVGAPNCPQCGDNDPRHDTGQTLAIPSVTVACQNDRCANLSVERRVMLRAAAPGVLERPALHCAGCGNEMWTVTQPETKEDDMPKVTVHGGPSHEAAEAAGEEGPWTRHDEDTEGSEQPSPGASSSTSSETPDNSPKTNDSEDQSPAPTTGNRSRKARTEGSTARSTGGGRKTATGSDNDSDE